jgi:hypothetical protein
MARTHGAVKHQEASMRVSSKPAIQYDRATKQLTVTMAGRKHKLGTYGDLETARRAAKEFIAKQGAESAKT